VTGGGVGATQVELEEANPQNRADYRGWGTLVTSYNQLVWLHVSLPVDVDWREVVLSGKEVDSEIPPQTFTLTSAHAIFE
jgi:hypothetical protein